MLITPPPVVTFRISAFRPDLAFCTDLRTNSCFSTKQLYLISFITQAVCVYCAVQKMSFYMIQIPHCLQAVPWLRRLVAGPSPRSPGFNLRSFQVRFVMDSGTGTVPVFRVPPASIIPPMLRIRLHVCLARTRGTNRRSLGTVQKAVPFRKSGSVTR